MDLPGIAALPAVDGRRHVLACMDGHPNVPLTADDFARLASHRPCLVNLQPSDQYLMEDFNCAGGLPVVMKEISHELHLDLPTVTGLSVGEDLADAHNWNEAVNWPHAQPFKAQAGIAPLPPAAVGLPAGGIQPEHLARWRPSGCEWLRSWLGHVPAWEVGLRGGALCKTVGSGRVC